MINTNYATGRNIEGFKRGIKKYNIDFFDYVICSNDPIILNNSLNVMSKNLFHEKDEKIIEQFFEDNKNMVESIEIGEHEGETYSYSITTNKEATAEWICQCLKEELETVVVQKNGKYIDITPDGTGKWSSLKKIFGSSGFNGVVSSIGDGENDIDILTNSDYSFSFPFANQKARNAAKMICNDFEGSLLEIHKIFE
ncbi:HAD hydrolase family protein [Enterococcus sp. BWB1-3]|uniref:HAD hydrolase family protein n=1 Tax=Enterococcus sp. BWB1-3 TaxID=2787713 RepID=UPI001923935F|nr:HAD hydrolase family protein [Enterococcus sp. BWB1-3]